MFWSFFCYASGALRFWSRERKSDQEFLSWDCNGTASRASASSFAPLASHTFFKRSGITSSKFCLNTPYRKIVNKDEQEKESYFLPSLSLHSSELVSMSTFNCIYITFVNVYRTFHRHLSHKDHTIYVSCDGISVTVNRQFKLRTFAIIAFTSAEDSLLMPKLITKCCV